MEMWYIRAMRYYSATKETAIMSFAAIRMNPEMVILDEVNQTEKGISYDTDNKGNLKGNDMSELTYKIETDSQI